MQIVESEARRSLKRIRLEEHKLQTKSRKRPMDRDRSLRHVCLRRMAGSIHEEGRTGLLGKMPVLLVCSFYSWPPGSD
jgi:hypothetical protein